MDGYGNFLKWSISQNEAMFVYCMSLYGIRFQKIKVVKSLLLNECSSFKAAWLEFNLSLALPSLCTGSFRTVRFVWLLKWLWAHRHAADFHPMKCQLWGFIPVKSGSKIEMVKWVIAHWENREWISQTRPTSAGFACTSKDAASRFHQPILSSKDLDFVWKELLLYNVCIAYIMKWIWMDHMAQNWLSVSCRLTGRFFVAWCGVGIPKVQTSGRPAAGQAVKPSLRYMAWRQAQALWVCAGSDAIYICDPEQAGFRQR